MLKKYQKAINYIFNKYSNTTGVTMKNVTFDKLEGKMQNIGVSDILKFCRDYEISQAFGISKRYIQNLVKKINMTFISYKYLNNLDLEKFNIFILNLAYRCFSQDYNDLRFLPAGKMLEQLIKFVASAAKKKGESTSMFRDPDLVANGANVDVNQLNIINKNLFFNPDLNVPDVYKKVTEKAQYHQYKFTSKLRKNLG